MLRGYRSVSAEFHVLHAIPAVLRSPAQSGPVPLENRRTAVGQVRGAGPASVYHESAFCASRQYLTAPAKEGSGVGYAGLIRAAWKSPVEATLQGRHGRELPKKAALFPWGVVGTACIRHL